MLYFLELIKRMWPWGVCRSVHTSPYWPVSYAFSCEGKKRHRGRHNRRCGASIITWDGTFRIC